MQKIDVKFGEWIQKGFDLYKNNLGTLILVSLLALVISVLTIGVLGGPMAVGAILVTLGLLDKKTPPPQIGDLFKGFNYFVNSLLFILTYIVVSFVVGFILALIPCLGAILGTLAGFVLQTLAMFALFNIADRNMDFIQATKESINVVSTNFWPFFGLSVVASILSSLGAIACGIGVIVTAPLYFCILAVAYRESNAQAAVVVPPAV